MARSVNSEFEERLIGLCLLHPEVAKQAAASLTPDAFVARETRQAFAAIRSIVASGGAASPVALLRELDRQKVKLDADTIDRWIADPGIPEDAPALIEALREARARRLLAQVAAELGKAAEEAADMEELSELASQRALAILAAVGEQEEPVRRIGQVLQEVAAAVADPTLASRRRIPFGLFLTLGRLLRGLEATRLYVVAGRPGMGKTALALQIALGAAEHGHARVLLFSLEMTAENLAERIVRQRTGIDPTDSPSWSDARRAEVLTAIDEPLRKLADMDVWICDRRGLRVTDIAVIARRVAAEAGGLDVILIDHLGLIRLPAGNSETTARKIGRVTQTLRELAADLDCAVVLLHQLNRDVERRENKRPTMADLRESGEVEQHADVVLGLYRPDYYAANNAGMAEVLALKNRDGKAGPNVGTLLRWNPQCVRFDEPTKEEIQAYRQRKDNGEEVRA